MFRRKCRIQYCQLVIQTSTPSTGLTPAHVCACPKHRPEFPTPYVVVLLVGLRLDVVIHFCWYWWNCWLSLFKCSFHNENKKRHEYFEPLQNNEWSLFQKRVVRTKFDIYIFIVKKPDFSKSKLKDVRYRSWYNINKQYKPTGQSRMDYTATMAT